MGTSVTIEFKSKNQAQTALAEFNRVCPNLRVYEGPGAYCDNKDAYDKESCVGMELSAGEFANLWRTASGLAICASHKLDLRFDFEEEILSTKVYSSTKHMPQSGVCSVNKEGIAWSLLKPRFFFDKKACKNAIATIKSVDWDKIKGAV